MVSDMNKVKLFLFRVVPLTICSFYCGVINAYGSEVDSLCYSKLSVNQDEEINHIYCKEIGSIISQSKANLLASYTNPEYNALWMEAEDLRTKNAGTAFSLVEDVSASGGKYLQTVNNITNSARLDSANILTARFTTSTATTYYIYARVKCRTWDEDSYWIGLDGKLEDVVNGLNTSDIWEWKLLYTGFFYPGQHRLGIGEREKGACIDKLCFTTCPQPPTGMGGASTSSSVIPITYSLSIIASGNGSASYSGSIIRSKTSLFTVNEGTNATITFSPDNGYRIKTVKVNSSAVTITNNQYIVSNIKANTTVSVEFEAIPPKTYTLSITASGNGSASYGGNTIRSKTSSFTVNSGSSATITFTPDNGYRIKSVKVNNSTVSVSNNQYTISSINANTTVSVEFEAIPVTTYTLSITASGNGSASYSGTTVRSKTSSFTVNAGTSATITFSPDNGYRIKSAKVNNSTVSVSNNQYTISSINANTTVSVEFEAIPVTTYTLSITASGNGSASYSGSSIRSKTSSFTVNEGTSVTITFAPDDGYQIKTVKVNSSTVTVSNNEYSISSINKNTIVEVEFEKNPASTQNVEINGIYYNLMGKTKTAEVTSNPNQYIGEIVIPNVVEYEGINYDVTNIGERAFISCSDLTLVTISNGVTSIGDAAFRGCSNLTSVNIPNSVVYIGNDAFSICSSIVSVNIPNSVTFIGKSAFYMCNALTSVSIPNSVTSIGDGAFSYCNLTIVNIPKSISKISDGMFSNNRNLTSVTIPDEVTLIGNSAFWGCSSLTSVNIPSSVTYIGKYAFSGCSSLTSVIIPNSVTSIEDNTFSECYALTSITIPNNVTSIGNEAFRECRCLNNVNIPNNVASIGDRAFIGCSGLASVTIPNYVISIGVSAFSDCSKLTSASISNSVTLIGESCFSGCSSLSSIKLPEDLQVIKKQTFYNCRNLREITIPSAIKYIYQEAFSGCRSIERIIVLATTVPFAYENSFSSYNEAILYVPDTVAYLYQETSPWSKFVSIKTLSEIDAPLTAYVLSITSLGNGSASYDGTTIRGKTSSFTVNEGTTVKISITPDNGYRIKSVKENNTVVTSYVSNGIYTINSLSRNTTVEVEFEEILQAFSANDVNYTVVSVDERIIRLAKGSYGITLEVPAKVSYQNAEWTVTGIDNGALSNNPDLAAIVWNPDVAFTEQVSNPNLLLYVNQTQYAPSSIKNVVVNGNATSITLTDAASGNNFHCPQAFTAQKISYTHNYSMETGIGEAKGWETIALPFDVQKVTHESKGEIVSFANWRSGDSKRPFWLMQLSASGWTMATSIKANTPYIISMPNNDEYKSGFLLNGRVTFSAENVNVAKTEDLSIANYSDRTFVPTFASLEKSNDMLALNVVNDIERVTGASTEGSTFERNLRPVHPFEAYMTSTSSTRSIGIDEGMATGIIELITALSDEVDLRIYNLNGQLIKIEEGRSLDEVMRELPAGIYIVNGKKTMIR